MSTAAANKILFERAAIKVTATRFDTGFATFQIKKITGVTVTSEKRRTRTGIPLSLAGLAALLGGILTNIPLLIVSGAAFTVGGAMMCFSKVNNTVVLTTRTGNVNALTSKDATLIKSIAAAVQEAINLRG
jgi:hypothetical protein